MSGLQASISTHIARQYFSPEQGWHANHTWFQRAVGDHPARLHNMYFTFLFLLRAVARAGDTLLLRPLRGLEGAGNGHYAQARQWVRALVTSPMSAADAGDGDGESLEGYDSSAPQQCREAFDESSLFQVPPAASTPQQPELYWQQLYDKQHLREDFRNRWRAQDIRIPSTLCSVLKYCCCIC